MLSKAAVPSVHLPADVPDGDQSQTTQNTIRPARVDLNLTAARATAARPAVLNATVSSTSLRHAWTFLRRGTSETSKYSDKQMNPMKEIPTNETMMKAVMTDGTLLLRKEKLLQTEEESHIAAKATESPFRIEVIPQVTCARAHFTIVETKFGKSETNERATQTDMKKKKKKAAPPKEKTEDEGESGVICEKEDDASPSSKVHFRVKGNSNSSQMMIAKSLVKVSQSSLNVDSKSKNKKTKVHIDGKHKKAVTIKQSREENGSSFTVPLRDSPLVISQNPEAVISRFRWPGRRHKHLA